MSHQVARVLIEDFAGFLGESWKPSEEVLVHLRDFLDGLATEQLFPASIRADQFAAIVRQKLKLNESTFRELLSSAADAGLYCNYKDRVVVQDCLDRCDAEQFLAWLSVRSADHNLAAKLLPLFRPLAAPTAQRELRRVLAVDPDAEAIRLSLFGGFVYGSFPIEAVHKRLNADSRIRYHSEFWEHIKDFYHDAIHREFGVALINVDERAALSATSYEQLAGTLFSELRSAHERLSNHCYVGVLLQASPALPAATRWRLYADLILFAEKYQEHQLGTGYFRPAKIQAQTLEHIPSVDPVKARFDLGNEGLYFRDCFVLETHESRGEQHLLLLFEKNERYERLIPCPACRSSDVRGNSYPVLGVKSWECMNQFCPERSKYNRGNRYSLSSLLKQAAIAHPENQIPLASLRQWKLDYATISSVSDVVDLMLRHYSLVGDSAVLTNLARAGNSRHGRTILHEPFAIASDAESIFAAFGALHWFSRYKLKRPATNSDVRVANLSTHPGTDVFHGDAFDVLQSLTPNSVQGAVTSPPYYNAREYATWPNIYCYLYDMYNVARMVYRVLEPGAPFLFNIFDYFDNENSIVFSAMGKKRMILGAYIIDMFEEIGLQLNGNVVWNKGQVEGKRVFNQGNMSPYYQTPLNCWEHILVFSKGELASGVMPFPSVLHSRPVFKMVRGRNVLGHTAPFPESIPRLLLERLKPGSTVLDPFSGSMTTGRLAHSLNIRSVNIDYKAEYCRLGLQLLEASSEQQHLALESAE